MTIGEVLQKERGKYKSYRVFRTNEKTDSFVEVHKAKESEVPYMYKIVTELESVYKQPTILLFI